jgi:hypothetical protein
VIGKGRRGLAFDFLDERPERRIRLQQPIDEVVIIAGFQALNRHEAMVGQLDDQQLARVEALTQRSLRVRLQPTQGDQLDAHRLSLVNGQGSQLPLGIFGNRDSEGRRRILGPGACDHH